MEKPKSWIYFMRSGEDGPIKIGFTGNTPMARLSALQTGNPEPLNLIAAIPGVREDETRLHERFAALRTKGEWFRAEPELLGFIDGVRMAHREQPKHYDDLFAWGDWMETIAQYASVRHAVEVVECARSDHEAARAVDEYLRAHAVDSLRASADMLSMSVICRWEGSRIYGHDKIDNTIGLARRILGEQPRTNGGPSPRDFSDIRACFELCTWDAKCEAIVFELNAGLGSLSDRRFRISVSDAWMTGVRIISNVLNPGDDYSESLRAAYLGVYLSLDVDSHVDLLRHMLALLRENGCAPPRFEIPDWLEDAPAEQAPAEVN